MNEIVNLEALLTETESPAEIVRTFATVGEVYEDGLSLIFDGETEPTEKHYKCATYSPFAKGDRVRIFQDSGTYVVEYAFGSPQFTRDGNYIIPTVPDVRRIGDLNHFLRTVFTHYAYLCYNSNIYGWLYCSSAGRLVWQSTSVSATVIA